MSIDAGDALRPRSTSGLSRLSNLRSVVHAAREDVIVGAVAWVVLATLMVALEILQPGTLSLSQIATYAGLSSVIAILAVGQTVVLLTGGIDVSVGGSLSVANVLAAMIITSRGTIVPGIVAVLAAGLVMGLANGLLVVYVRLQPLIATLGMWFVWAGLALIIFPLPGGHIPQSMGGLFTGHFLSIANPYWLLLVTAVVGYWMLRTRLGLSIRAIGSDPVGAAQSGINSKLVLISAYAICGLFTGIGGILLAAQTQAGDPQTGANYLLPIVTAAVVGGTSLLGGRGGAIGGIVGAMILTYVSAIAAAANLPSQWAGILDGTILIVAVASQYLLRRLLAKTWR